MYSLVKDKHTMINLNFAIYVLWNLTYNIIEGFDIGLDKTRIGVINYSTMTVREFDLDTHGSRQEVLNAVDQISYSVSLQVEYPHGPI